jgi:hypothetical protein
VRGFLAGVVRKRLKLKLGSKNLPRPARPPNFFWTPARRIWIDKGAMNTGR